MKQTVQMERIQRNMAPGVMTRDGFLGTDRRKLIDILIADDAAVKRRDLDHRRIAAAMRSLRNAGMRGLGELITVPPNFEVRVESVRGKLPCPFGHPGLIAKTRRSGSRLPWRVWTRRSGMSSPKSPPMCGTRRGCASHRGEYHVGGRQTSGYAGGQPASVA